MPAIREKVTLTEEEQAALFRQAAETGETKSNVLRSWMGKPPLTRGAEAGNNRNPFGRHGKTSQKNTKRVAKK